MSTTIAQQISGLFDDDGQIFETPAGLDIDHACKARQGARSYRDGHGTAPYRYDFPDGSSIVIADACWDLGVDGCEGYCMAGVGCECPERCADCGEDIYTAHLALPAVDDHSAWALIADGHADGCEWVATRAHRIEVVA